jgi:hypothetical protein
MPSKRYATEARLLSVLASDVPDVGALCAIAEARAYAPEAARRARRLLDLAAPEDALDKVVLAAVRARWRRTRIEQIDAGDDPAPWGIDLVRREVYVDRDRAIPMRRHGVLLKVLEVCASSAGPVPKEQLAREVWGVTRYHPHRDDARIQMAVSRLRRLVEPDGERERVLTLGDAYALARPLWLLREVGAS